MSKFILPGRPRRKSNKANGEVIRIDSDSYNLLAEMSQDSGYPVGKIASLAIKYAYTDLSYEIEEEEEE